MEEKTGDGFTGMKMEPKLPREIIETAKKTEHTSLGMITDKKNLKVNSKTGRKVVSGSIGMKRENGSKNQIRNENS